MVTIKYDDLSAAAQNSFDGGWGREKHVKSGGRYMVRGGNTLTLEGQPPARIVITAFKGMADTQKWYESPEYSALRPLRQRSAKSRSFIVERFDE